MILLRKWTKEVESIYKPIFRYFYGVNITRNMSSEKAARLAWGQQHCWWGQIPGGLRGRILGEFDVPGWVFISDPGMPNWKNIPKFVPGWEDNDNPLSWWTEEYSLTAKTLRGYVNADKATL